ncbi:transmembrane exosortase [bacterium BMS3Abin15]|nr:transmembrane exosortase [bacterium BMS3Abin15]
MINYIIWILVAAIYTPSFIKLYSVRWDMLDYTHAYFILPVSLWLIWRKRDQIKESVQGHKPGENLLGLIVLFFSIILFLFGSRFDYSLIITFSIIPFIFGLSYYLYGIKTVKLLSFPVLYLLLLIPPPMSLLDSITLPMRYAISSATEIVLRFANYPISKEGLLLTIGYNDIFMGQPCSGFRSLITLLSLGIVYIYISDTKLFNKFILAAFIVPLALLGNLIRVITLCLITFYFGEAAGQGFFHNFSGIVMFIITILGLIGIESVLNKISSINT